MPYLQLRQGSYTDVMRRDVLLCQQLTRRGYLPQRLILVILDDDKQDIQSFTLIVQLALQILCHFLVDLVI